jgi:hypothetical protein
MLCWPFIACSAQVSHVKIPEVCPSVEAQVAFGRLVLLRQQFQLQAEVA